jgi:inosine triphosphate pyrophosphatase
VHDTLPATESSDISIPCSRADFLEAVGEDGLWDVVRRFEDRSASTVCTLGAVQLRKEPPRVLLFKGSLSGTVVSPRGDVRHGKRSWNSSFEPEGHARTFGEMPIEEQSSMSHRHKALAAFAEHVRTTMPAPM